ncbi:MAG: hypothetical protein A3K67_01110 [Euryarchaeota archaeon RBG_16_62_10]|nr:MAG: hypothetical protein A3K67_01110 [Euryarchaeota archaeon RBG_16_62_10]
MTPRMLVPIALFVAGVSLIVVAVATGEAEVSLFLIFPVFSGSSGIFLLGTLLIVFSFIVGLSLMMMGQAGLARGALEPLPTAKEIEAGAGTRYGGVVLVGPVPIAFGSDKNLAVFMLVLGIALAIVFLGILVLLA